MLTVTISTKEVEKIYPEVVCVTRLSPEAQTADGSTLAGVQIEFKGGRVLTYPGFPISADDLGVKCKVHIYVVNENGRTVAKHTLSQPADRVDPSYWNLPA